MRIFHTSDWHLGRTLHGVDLLSHQAAYADHLLAVIESQKVDVVVVSGDFYDRALPHVDAVALADDILARLAASRASTIISSGNHDSAIRLGFGSRVFAAAGIHLRTEPEQCVVPIVCADEHGPVSFYAIPFLDPVGLLTSWQLPDRSHSAALEVATTKIHAAHAQRGGRSVVLAHAFVAGGEPTDSERDISVGGVERVPTSLFTEFSYAALGHLHRPHQLAPNINYSGSPLAFSFSEADHVKGGWLVDLAGTGQLNAEFVEAPVPRPMARIRGRLSDLLVSPRWQTSEQAWVEASVTDPLRPLGAVDQLRARFPHLLHIRHEPERPDLPESGFAPTGSRNNLQLTLDFVSHVRGVSATPPEHRLLTEALERCCQPDIEPVAQ